MIVSSEEQTLPPVDEIIATTGFRPNLEMLRELRLDIDPVVESPTTLAPVASPACTRRAMANDLPTPAAPTPTANAVPEPAK